MEYIAQARRRLAAIVELSEGKPTHHIYTVTQWGKVCVGCGKARDKMLPRCDGSKYDSDPTRALSMKMAALSILKLEVEALLNKLTIADQGIEMAVKTIEATEGRKSLLYLGNDLVRVLAAMRLPVE